MIVSEAGLFCGDLGLAIGRPDKREMMARLEWVTSRRHQRGQGKEQQHKWLYAGSEGLGSFQQNLYPSICCTSIWKIRSISREKVLFSPRPSR